ncbi:MAG: hypothetical protein J5959_02265, partial [Butyrivibrio sp.]|nr:hypothetical protein [Butyrivibrio sp.]
MMDDNKFMPDAFSIFMAIILYFSFGILLTVGSLIWVREEIQDYFDLSYSAYGMFLIVIFCVAELWAMFIQIPTIKGYASKVASWFNVTRIVLGTIFLLILIACLIAYGISPNEGGF